MIAGAERVLAVTGGANAASAGVFEESIDLRKQVSIVMMADAGAEGESQLLHAGILDEFLPVKSVEVDPARDEITQISGRVPPCLADSDFSVITPATVQCIVDEGRKAKTDYELIVGLKKDGENYSASFLVVENTRVRVVENSRAFGSPGEVREAAGRLIRRIFGHAKEASLPEIDLSSPPDAGQQDDARAFILDSAPQAARESFLERRKWPLILGGLAAATAAAALALGAAARQKEDDAHGAPRQDDAFASYDEAKKFALSANILFGVSAAFGAGAIATSF